MTITDQNETFLADEQRFSTPYVTEYTHLSELKTITTEAVVS